MKKVVKFGGSSLASARQFKKVGEIIRSDKSRRYVVPSAPGKRNDKDEKVTDLLYECYDAAYAGASYKKILENVADYLKPNGYILFEIGYNQGKKIYNLWENSKKNIELMVEKKEDFVEFSVQDYGAGMATEDLTKVFSGMGLQKRKDGDSSRGLGLGMSICKIIIEAHSGQIFAENTAGKGLRVAFRLPMEEKKA